MIALVIGDSSSAELLGFRFVKRLRADGLGWGVLSDDLDGKFQLNYG